MSVAVVAIAMKTIDGLSNCRDQTECGTKCKGASATCTDLPHVQHPLMRGQRGATQDQPHAVALAKGPRATPQPSLGCTRSSHESMAKEQGEGSAAVVLGVYDKVIRSVASLRQCDLRRGLKNQHALIMIARGRSGLA